MNKKGKSNPALTQDITIRWFVVIFGLALTYSICRYHIFNGVGWSHFPLYIFNKATALGAILFISCSYLIGKVIRVYESEKDKKLVLIKFCGLIGFSLAAIHAFVSLLLFSPEYYSKFFLDSGKLNLIGELSMIFGVLSLWCLSITAIASLPFMYNALGVERWQRGQRLGYVTLFLAAGHVLFMGFSSWLKPESWPGHLPPISLVAFIAASFPVLIKLIRL